MRNKDEPILICIAGLNGAISTTLISGICALKNDLVSDVGLVTESAQIKDSGIPFPLWNQFHFTGWDLISEDLYTSTVRQGICPKDYILEHELNTIHPRPSIQTGVDASKWIQNETTFVKKRALSINAKKIIFINLLPTEPYSSQVDNEKINWDDISTLDLSSQGITISRLFFRLAIECGAHHINFTPNHAETNGLKLLAQNRKLLFCGRDGKTGQTFIKTVLAPAMRDRHLQVNGWFSTNILGNEDGKTLNLKDSFLTKQKSKSESLKSILGYVPGGAENEEFSHQIQIHYYPPRGDNKESWDNIDFSGFLGSPMQMKINWLGKDSILAAPLIIDMIRVMCVSANYGQTGLIKQLAYFFKSPIREEKGAPINHSTPDQFNKFQSYLYQLSKLGKPDKTKLDLVSDGAWLELSDLEKKALFLDQYLASNSSSLSLDFVIRCIEEQLCIQSNCHKSFISTCSSSIELLRQLIAKEQSRRPVIFLMPELSGGNPEVIKWATNIGCEVHFIPVLEHWGQPDWEELNNEIKKYVGAWIYFDIPFQTHLLNFENLIKNSGNLLVYNVSHSLHLMLSLKLGNLFENGVDVILGDTQSTYPLINVAFALSGSETTSNLLTQRLEPEYKADSGWLRLATCFLETSSQIKRGDFISASHLSKHANELGEYLSHKGFAPDSYADTYSETGNIRIPHARIKSKSVQIKSLLAKSKYLRCNQSNDEGDFFISLSRFAWHLPYKEKSLFVKTVMDEVTEGDKNELEPSENAKEVNLARELLMNYEQLMAAEAFL